MQSIQVKSARRNFQVIECDRIQERRAYEESIEARLQDLADTVERFVESLSAALLAEQSPTRGLLEELVVKQSALQWIVRVAKHSEGAVRQRLWSDIEQSLAGLEKTAELLPRLGFMWHHSRIPAEGKGSAASFHWT